MIYEQPEAHQHETEYKDNGFLESVFASAMMIVSVIVLGFLVSMFAGCAALPRPTIHEISVSGGGNPGQFGATTGLVTQFKY
jgi:hypothetical protein